MAWKDGEAGGLPNAGAVGGKDATPEQEGAPLPEVVKPAHPILVGPDGEVYVEGAEGKEGLLMTPKKKDASLAGISVKAALLLLLAASGWMLYTKMVAPPAQPEPRVLPPRPQDPRVAEKIDKMIESRHEFDRQWEAASDKVRQAFTSLYMPSTKTERVAVSQAVSFFKLHVLELTDLNVPDDIEFKNEYLLKVNMVTCILNAAAKRLEGLRLLEDDTDLPALIFERESGKKTKPMGSIALGHFLNLLEENNISYSPAPAGQEAAVSHSKALELIDFIVMEDKMLAMDKTVQQQFKPFLQAHGKSLETMTDFDTRDLQSFLLPRDDIGFNVELFGSFLLSRYKADNVANYRGELLDSLCQKFDNESMNKAIEGFKDHYEKTEDDLVRQKTMTLEKAREKGQVKLTSGFAIATFLL